MATSPPSSIKKNENNEKTKWRHEMKRRILSVLIAVSLFACVCVPAFAGYKGGSHPVGMFKENPYFAASGGGITQPSTSETSVWLRAASGDTSDIYVFGEIDGTITGEIVTLTETDGVSLEFSYSEFYSFRKSATTGVVTIETVETTPEVLAQIPAASLYCYNAGTLNDDDNNFPVGVAVTTTGYSCYTGDTWVLSDSYPVINLKCSNVTIPITAKYQLSDDDANWIDGAVSISNLDNNQQRKTATEPYVRYLRLVLTQNTNTVEAKPSVNVLVINK